MNFSPNSNGGESFTTSYQKDRTRIWYALFSLLFSWLQLTSYLTFFKPLTQKKIEYLQFNPALSVLDSDYIKAA